MVFLDKFINTDKQVKHVVCLNYCILLLLSFFLLLNFHILTLNFALDVTTF